MHRTDHDRPTARTRPQVPTPIDLAAIAVLRAAADYINAHGWCQHRLYDFGAEPVGDPPMACATGAIYAGVFDPVACTGHVGEAALHAAADPAVRRALAILAGHLAATGRLDRPDGVPDDDVVAHWNDHPDRDTFQVTDALYAAAATRAGHHPAGGAR